MSQESRSDSERILNSFNGARRAEKRITVFDCRRLQGQERIIETSGMDFNGFRELVIQQFSIPATETFYLTTTDRMQLDFDKFQELWDGNTLYLLQTEDQELPVPTTEQIAFVPHHDTLVSCGMYEYYTSEGQNSLPYALAELIDNSLSATAHNNGERTIELRLLFDDTLGRPAVVFLDNGCGMTPRQLNDWAVYRLNKFKSNHKAYKRPEAVPHCINSDISYFGVGGKQAVFYIGNATRMITRPAGFIDVHELILSKEDFETKEKNKDNIYSGVIHNRKVGDSSHVQGEGERFLLDLIAEETEKESFTAVVITGIRPEHVAFLKKDFNIWTRELAHIYHYYIHGTDGNTQDNKQKSAINIQITLREKPTTCPKVMNLREVDDDMQTLYINSAKDTFEFKAHTVSGGTVEGVLRYHPFLYDRETYPKCPLLALTEVEEEDEEFGAGNKANRRQHIFECFWNGRLIPYTTVSELQWCQRPSKHCSLPVECYSRFSGVLFVNDQFQVSTNKLTFIDLELQLRREDTTFKRVVNGQEQRVTIQREFNQWLSSCHEHLDKQVHFIGFNGTITRDDMSVRRMQHPWATFSSIEWDNKTYRAGQLVKSQRTQPIMYGSIVQFLLYGDHDGDIYATGGQVEVSLEPKEVHDERRIFLIAKIDRTATNASIQRVIDNELTKLPDKLEVEWPENNSWSQNAGIPAGTKLGPLKVVILNKKGDAISRMPSPNQGAVRKLAMELRVVWHGPREANQDIHNYIAQHTVKWAFWFKPMENLTKLGKYTLELNTMLNESNAKEFGGKQLPSYKLNFTITEGKAMRFEVDGFNSNLYVGMAFDMVLKLMDKFNHPVSPPPDLRPELTCSDLDVSYEKTTSSGTALTINAVRVRGSLLNHQCKVLDLKVVLPGLDNDSQNIKITLLPGVPHTLSVTADDDNFTVENGNSLTFNIKIHDEAGNIKAQPKLIVHCLVSEHLRMSVDCSATGVEKLITKPISLKNLKEQCTVKAKFEIPSQRHVPVVWQDVTVVPSMRVCRLEVYRSDAGEPLVLTDNENVEWQAGDLLENLYYRLYCEGQRLLPLSEVTASNVKVNWVGEVNLNDLAMGRLPNIQVPMLVKNKSFYQISYKDQRASVDTSFYIVPCPQAPSQLKVTLDQASVKMGDVLPGDIHLQLLDQFGNLTQKMTPQCVEHIKVEGEELDSCLDVSWQESSKEVVVRGVRFRPGPPGPRELTFSLRTFVKQVKVMVTAGLPAKLQLVSGPRQPIQVLNLHGITSPFLIQLCDTWGNPSKDQRVVVVLAASSPSLKVMSSVMSKPLDEEGKASFMVDHVAGPKGQFSLEFSGLFNQKPIPGPSVPLTVVLDPNKPASLAVDYDSNASITAGGTLPVFSVTVVSEEGGPVGDLSPAAIDMKLWKGETSTLTPPARAIEFCCSEMDHVHFKFRDKAVPQLTGRYSLQFSLTSGETVLQSQQYVLDVVANKPTKLAPDSQPTTLMVSNIETPASRVLVEDLTLQIRDTFDNPTGQELEGQVEVRVELPPGDSDKDLPLLEAPSDHLCLPLTTGIAHFSKLSIRRSSPGSNGTQYVLVFETQLKGTETTLAPYRLPFYFYNDADTLRQMSELSRKKEALTEDLNRNDNYSRDLMDLINELECKYQRALGKRTELKTELFSRMDEIGQLESVEAVINEKLAFCQRILTEPRRTCSIPDPFRGPQDVLGKVCHLALVEDEASARVISWHIQRDMDCLVTLTTVAAQRVYSSTQGGQQVLPLDSVYVSPNVRPLPHPRRLTQPPPGNPIFARDLLIYPKHEESCEKVFRALLGDTILIDDLDTGNAYRKSVVQSRRPCPTILTRQGHRISSKGKFGGALNRAPDLSALHGLVFGAPLPHQYHALMEQMDNLYSYRNAMVASEEAKEELNTQRQVLLSAEHVKREKEMDANKQQLTEIHSQLERMSVSTLGKRAFRDIKPEEGAGEPSGPQPRRPRTSS